MLRKRQKQRILVVVAIGTATIANLVGGATLDSAHAARVELPNFSPEFRTPIRGCPTPPYIELLQPWLLTTVGTWLPTARVPQNFLAEPTLRFDANTGGTVTSERVVSYEGQLEGRLKYPGVGTIVGQLVYPGGYGLPPFRRATTIVGRPSVAPTQTDLGPTIESPEVGTIVLRVQGNSSEPKSGFVALNGVSIPPTSVVSGVVDVLTFRGLDPSAQYDAVVSRFTTRAQEVPPGSGDGFATWPEELRSRIRPNGKPTPHVSLTFGEQYRTFCESGSRAHYVVTEAGPYAIVTALLDGMPFESDADVVSYLQPASEFLSPGPHTLTVSVDGPGINSVSESRTVVIPPLDPSNIDTFWSVDIAGTVRPEAPFQLGGPVWSPPATTTVPPPTTTTTTTPTTTPPTTTTTTTTPTTTTPTTTTTTTPTTTVSPPTTAPPSSDRIVITCPAGSLNIGDDVVVATSSAEPGSSVSLTANGIPLGTSVADLSGRASVRNSLWISGPVTLVLTEAVFRSGVEKHRSGSCGLASFDSQVAAAPTLRVPESVQIGKPFSVSVTGIGRPSGRVDLLVGSIPAGSVSVSGSSVEFTTTAWSSTQTVITAVWVDFDRGVEFRRSASSNVRIEP
jgi:cell division septation protein DedD